MTRLPRAGRQLLVFALLTLVTAWGCTQLLGAAEIRDRRKFIIEAEPLRLDLPASERPYQLRVQIDRFSVSRLYERDQIIFRLTPEEIDDDRYNSWAVRPGDMITNAVAEYLRRAGMFTDMREDFLNTTPDLTLTGTINAIERFDSGDRWFAHLDVTIQLVDRQNKIFWRHRFDPNEIEVYDPDMVFTVQALRGLLRQNMGTALKSLDLALLIRKASLEGRDLTDLLQSNSNGNGTKVATPDTAQIPMETEDYRIFPGNLVPESR
jgi:ABC-type uncharacterized transport system auxiliary subunit